MTFWLFVNMGVLAALRQQNWNLSEPEVDKRLEYLWEHGNLTRDYDYDDTAMTLALYERRQHIYDLTPEGEVVHDALSIARDSLRRVGGHCEHRHGGGRRGVPWRGGVWRSVHREYDGLRCRSHRHGLAG